MNFTKFVIKAKEVLPFNGDWLYVTLQTPPPDNDSEDLVPQLTNTADVSREIESENELEVLKLVYERAKAYESSIYTSADHVRDKAKTLLGTATFVSAIIFGVAALYVNSIAKSYVWVVVVESLLFFLLISHMFRALSVVINVMTREISVKQSAFELLESKGNVNDYYKRNISHIIAYANQTSSVLHSRINDLIIAQSAYRYGLRFFILMILVHLSNIFFLPSDSDPNNRKLINNSVVSICGSLQSIKSELRLFNSNIAKLSQDVQKLHLPQK